MIEFSEEMRGPQSKIRFILGEETRPKIELFENNNADSNYSFTIQDSIFYRQYCLALSAVAELVAYNKKSTVHLSHNNIFVFTGERGTGKTSCMLTVRELLCDSEKKRKRYSSLAIEDNLKDILINTSFIYFDLIDPIYFDGEHNILDLFVGTLFSEFQKTEKRKGFNQISENDRMKLLNKFSETKRNLCMLNKAVTLSEFDDLEQLSDLAASINFKTSLEELVQLYIKYKGEDNGQLVLCIDDIDLNMDKGYEMIEQVRKYLNISGLVVMMAIKIEQLENVIRIKYSKDFSPLLSQNEKEYDITINQIVERYITKLFPLTHRIYLPTVSYLLDKNVDILQYKDGNLQYKATLTPLKDGILRLIYKKFRLLAFHTTRQINYIIPRNLRELLNFVHLLYSMEDAKGHKDAIPNLLRFKDYFYGIWCTNNLLKEDLDFIRCTLNILNAGMINQMVIRFLEKRFDILASLKTDEKNIKDNSIRELIYILDKKNIMYNLSLGDVLACLDWLDKVYHKEEDLNLLFAVKMFYTIALYEKFRTSKEIQEEEKKREAEIINRELLTNNKTDYGDILNGNFFNSEYINAAPYEKGEISRCRRIISHQKINDSTTSNLKDFFILTTSFVIDNQDIPKNVDVNNLVFSHYRKRKEVYYEKEISKSRKYVCFDVLSIFYNLLDISVAYKRYGIEGNEEQEKKVNNEKAKLEKIQSIKRITRITLSKLGLRQFITDELLEKETEVRLKTEMSPLYKEILLKIPLPEDIFSKIKDRGTVNDFNKNDFNKKEIFLYKREEILLYTLNIRNIEILEQISYKLQRERPDSGNLDSIKKMFKNLSDYKMMLYDGSVITCSFFSAISECLDGISEDDFNAIYVDQELV